MNFPNSLLVNMLFLVSSRVATTVMNIFTVSHLAKALGVGSFGIYNFGLAYISYFLVVVNLGYETYLARETARRPATICHLAGSAIAIRLLLAGAMTSLLLISFLVLNLSTEVKLVLIILSSMLFSAAANLSGVYQGLQRMQLVARREILGAFCNLVGTILLVHNSSDLLIAAIVSSGSTMLTNGLLLWQYLNEFGSPLVRKSRRFFLPHARRSIAYFWTMLLIVISYNTPVVLLGLMRSEAEVGLFSAGWKLFSVATTVPALVSTLFLPRFAAAGNQPTGKAQTSEAYFKLMLLCSLPVSVIGSALAEKIVLVLFGPAFSEISDIIILFLVNAFVVSLNVAFSTPLMAGDRQKDVVRIGATGVLAGIGLDFLLIFFWGVKGAALACLATDILILALYINTRPEIALAPAFHFFGKCVLAAIPTYFAIMLVQNYVSRMPPLIIILICSGVGSAIYLVALFSMRVGIGNLLTELRRM